MSMLEIIALSNFALIDIIAFEIILSAIFFVDNGGRVKFTLDWMFGMSKFVATYIFVVVFLLLSFTYFFVTNFFQNKIIEFMVNGIGYNLITSFFALLSFAVFWICKIILGRKFRFHLCWISFTTWIIFTILFGIILVTRYV